MKFYIYIISFFFIWNFSKGQTNLVPNPSFEDTTSCPEFAQLSYCLLWNSPNLGTPDYFNGCTFSNVTGVPNNAGGYQNAYSGVAYVGIQSYINDGGFYEYISTDLITPLDSGKKYLCEFYVSTADISLVGINRMGIYISSMPYLQNDDLMLPFSSQVENDSTIILKDTINWVKISGEYLAQGGEEYIFIGNFYPVNQIDTANINYTGVGNYAAYYYIDDVSVTEILDTTDTVNPIDSTLFDFTVFPNPNNGEFTLNYQMGTYAEGIFRLYDAIGKLVYEEELIQFNGIRNIEISLSSGVYIWEVMSGDLVLKRAKMVIQR